MSLDIRQHELYEYTKHIRNVSALKGLDHGSGN